MKHDPRYPARWYDAWNDPPWLFAGIVALIVWMVVR